MPSEVPRDWRAVSYRDIASINAKSLKGSTDPDLEIAYLDISSVPSPGVVESPRVLSFEEAPSRARRIVRSGDTILSTVRPYLQSFAYVEDAADNLVASTGFAVLTPKRGTDAGFLYQSVYSTDFMRHLEATMTGSNYPAVNASDVASAPVLLPPLPQQEKIAAILSSVDEAIQATKAVIEQTRRVKEGLLQDLLTRGIGHTQFKQTEIGEIPESWEVRRLSALTRKITDGTHQGVTTTESGTHRFLYVTCVRPGRIVWENAAWLTQDVFETISRGRVPERGCVLYTAVGATLGYAAVVDTDEEFSFQRHLAILYPDRNALLPGFLAAILNSPQVVRRVWALTTGNAQPSITLGELKKLRAAIPPLREQQAIVNVLAECDSSVKQAEDANNNLQQVKAGLLQDLLTGKVRVSV